MKKQIDATVDSVELPDPKDPRFEKSRQAVRDRVKARWLKRREEARKRREK